MNTTATPKRHQSDTKIVSHDTKNLEFVRLKIPRLIPLALIEAVKGRTFTPEQFIAYQERNIDSPNNYLYALIDPEKKIQGVLWLEMNTLDNSLFVTMFSIAKIYWGKGAGIEKVIEFVDKLKDKMKASKVFWITVNEKFYMKHGFKRSKQSLMEYNSK